MPKQFIWLVGSSLPRHGMPKLIQGKIHEVADYSADVVDVWVKTRAAKYVVDQKKSKKEENK